MAASREEISSWFDRGVEANASYMIVVCDTFDYEDYPILCETEEVCTSAYDEHNGNKNMQKVMEVYDLRQPKEEQLNEQRCMRLPKERG